MAINGTRFTFASGELPEDTFVVVDFDLTQSLSTLFCLKVTLASSEPAIGFENLLDETATLTIWQGEEVQRRVRGIVTLCEQGDTGKHQTLYHLNVFPEFWRSGQRQNCRSFQNQDIASIFDTLLREMGITTYEMRCRSPHPIREFCVQFMETDFAFISRLAAEEGICFFEDEYIDSNTQNLVFADHCLSMSSIGATPYNPNRIFANIYG
ncbi:type VI secretion system tip protein VgrG [Rahnella sp. PCH160]|uniref:type VI secretion system tip protein VgrG n=1 Tax=Rahnella sp. PCH160 TaxID=3447928 RepID=UPI0039FD5E0B